MADLVIEGLQLFGLTKQEANIYLALISYGRMTGYEVSKQTGISRSNAYSALAGLVDKGAAYAEEGTATKYTAVDPKEFMDAKRLALQEKEEELLLAMPKKKVEEEGYLTIEGDQNIENRIHSMIEAVEKRIYIRMQSELVLHYLPELLQLKEKGKKVVVITDQKLPFPGAKQYVTDVDKNQIGIIVDSVNVLTGEYGNPLGSVCLYTGQKNFVRVFKDSLKNEMKLIELTGGKHE